VPRDIDPIKDLDEMKIVVETPRGPFDASLGRFEDLPEQGLDHVLWHNHTLDPGCRSADV
jgi:hypothetical protein